MLLSRDDERLIIFSCLISCFSEAIGFMVETITTQLGQSGRPKNVGPCNCGVAGLFSLVLPSCLPVPIKVPAVELSHDLYVCHQVGTEQWTCLSFLDDGCSMDRAELRQAVKFDPPSDQATCTTSRFGEGMKAAAFWLSTPRSAIFLFALKGSERTVVLLVGNTERDLDRCSLIIAPEIRQQDGADETLACAPKDRKSGLRDITNRLCRIPTPKGCAGNEGSPYDSVQNILQVCTILPSLPRKGSSLVLMLVHWPRSPEMTLAISQVPAQIVHVWHRYGTSLHEGCLSLAIRDWSDCLISRVVSSSTEGKKQPLI